MVQKKPIQIDSSEPLGLEHGDTEVDEHHDGDREEEALDDRHTRSMHQMYPRNTAMKAMKLTIARKSATTFMLSGSA
jgi:hypothetical protein